uniref:Uncharacterized protein n=1 Tax=Capra hircus TaxID=9925 RepID=A0A8C2SC86_CAPHI
MFRVNSYENTKMSPLSSVADARDAEQLSKNKVTHILSVHDSARPMLEADISFENRYPFSMYQQ